MSAERRATRRSTAENRGAAAIEEEMMATAELKTLMEVNSNLKLNPKEQAIAIPPLVDEDNNTTPTAILLAAEGAMKNDENGEEDDEEEEGAPDPKMPKLDDEDSGLNGVEVKAVEVVKRGGKATHQCPQCEKRFIKKGILTKHLKSHSQPRPFVCEFEDCDKSFVNRKALDKHVKGVHQGEEFLLHLCQFCQKGFITRAEMDHHAEDHLQEYKMYACRFCGKTFNKKFAMKIAVQASHDQIPDPCPYCNKVINAKAYKDN